MEKKCFKCGDIKDLNQFYAHPQMADGHLNKCKECAKKDVRGRTHVARKERAAYEHERFKRPERKAQILEYQRKRREKNPEKHKAYVAVRNALRDHKISKVPCLVCGSTKVQAHHPDYSQPLNVMWLCRKHHLVEHGKESISF